ncbi:hypothetical protein NA57DRAFT_58329 [Rhizodiscina lignyota]|uniref:Uncharacterized protein n=1 Tax=Rhizodiscina lignyota TaxID=1504668 RepID=A0A9P4IBN6_9PEZI|nr:hypothetical protein NA57DRAFT_58329 [Rhizodiscina lignyota]
MAITIEQVRQILTPELLHAVYRLKFPWPKNEPPSGATIGQMHFRPSPSYMKSFHDLIFHSALLPLSKLPLDELMSLDLTEVLPEADAPDYPEQSLGLITLLDQARIILKGYSFRYVRAFFDPICEKLARQLIALPGDFRPDGKGAWIERDYTMDEWLVRTLWFWAPLVHSDKFMAQDREDLKDWLHTIRSNVRTYSGKEDPFVQLEDADDRDVRAFKTVEDEGPPKTSYENPEEEADVADYAFWWIRILNSHFAITDTYKHYPYWIRWTGAEWTEKDKEFFQKNDNYRYDPANEPILEEVRQDSLKGVWKPLKPNPKFETNAQ